MYRNYTGHIWRVSLELRFKVKVSKLTFGGSTFDLSISNPASKSNSFKLPSSAAPCNTIFTASFRLSLAFWTVGPQEATSNSAVYATHGADLDCLSLINLIVKGI